MKLHLFVVFIILTGFCIQETEVRTRVFHGVLLNTFTSRPTPCAVNVREAMKFTDIRNPGGFLLQENVGRYSYPLMKVDSDNGNEYELVDSHKSYLRAYRAIVAKAKSSSAKGVFRNTGEAYHAL